MSSTFSKRIAPTIRSSAICRSATATLRSPCMEPTSLPTSTSSPCSSVCSTISTTVEKFPATDTIWSDRLHHFRLQREDVAHRLSQQGAHLRFQRQRRRRISARAGNSRRGRSRDRLSLGQPREEQFHLSHLRRIMPPIWCKSQKVNSPMEGTPSPVSGNVPNRTKSRKASGCRRMSAIRAAARAPGRGLCLG